jgi:hypothetical protein
LIALVYVSRAPEHYDERMLHDIQRAAVRRNREVGVTGMLLHLDGWFLQLLEGPANVVNPLYETIRNDPRHTDAIVLHRGAARERLFPGWSMGVLDHDATRPQDDMAEPINALMRLCLESPEIDDRNPSLGAALRRSLGLPGAGSSRAA